MPRPLTPCASEPLGHGAQATLAAGAAAEAATSTSSSWGEPEVLGWLPALADEELLTALRCPHCGDAMVVRSVAAPLASGDEEDEVDDQAEQAEAGERKKVEEQGRRERHTHRQGPRGRTTRIPTKERGGRDGHPKTMRGRCRNIHRSKQGTANTPDADEDTVLEEDAPYRFLCEATFVCRSNPDHMMNGSVSLPNICKQNVKEG